MDKNEILKHIRDKADRPMRVKELARELGVGAEEYSQFRRTVKQLLSSGEIVELKRNRIGLADHLNVLVGPISVTRKGIGFVPREGADDLLIPAADMGTALDGDKVMVRRTGTHFDREAGTVIRVLERAARNIVGVFHVGRHFSFVTPDNPRIHRDIYIPVKESNDAKEGEKVVAVITDWDQSSRNPEGKITERLGFPGEPGVDMKAIIKSFNLSEEFPPEVLDEAERASARLSAGTKENRVDLTGECIYTIDPDDAKDFDDAVSVTKTADGYQLGVHIADVSHFVEPGTALDDEAFRRGTSVYLPGMVIPMLPESLSNDVCSLKPNRRRLAHSATMQFDNSGKMLSWVISDSVIKSAARLTYEEVQAFFDSGKTSAKLERVAENLTLARELAQKLTKRRMDEGSLDFDLPESKIVLNDRGEVLELGHKVRLEAHRLVEEFMLVANQAVALELFRAGRTSLYRVHDKPDLEKLEAFSDMVKRLGYSFPVSETMHPKQFSRFLKTIEDGPEADFINELMLRSMKKAVYQRANIGHFGLAFTHYTHFTSPIRRYPDLLIHRLLRKHRYGEFTGAFAARLDSVIDHVGAHCSDTEREAETAERQAVKVKQVSYMAKHIGEEYGGVITGVTPYGFYVRLDNLGVEGLVRMSSIDDDFYNFEERNYRIIGRRHSRSFRLGDAVHVGLMKVDKVAGEIDLFLAEPERKPSGRRGTHRAINEKRKTKQSKKRGPSKARTPATKSTKKHPAKKKRRKK